MATEYYCDLDQDFDNPANVGDTSGNPALGCGGFKSMIAGWGNHDQLVKGDTLKVKGTGDESKLIKITVDVDKSATWVISDVVENYNDGGGASGDDWVGELVFIDATTLWVQINAASGDIDSVDTADGVYNVTRTDSIAGANMTTAIAPGIQVEGVSGDANEPLSIVGVNSSWVEDGTLSTLDGKLKADNNLTVDDFDYGIIRNLRLKDSAGAAFLGVVNYSYYVKFVNLVADGAVGAGLDGLTGSRLRYSKFIQCQAYDCGGNGFSIRYNNSAFGCTAYNNANGFHVHDATLKDCVAFENTGFGLNLSGAGAAAVNCVSDKNADGIYSGAGATAIGCRITNNTNYGIEGTYTVYDPYCFYSGNGANFENAIHVDTIGGVSTRTLGTVDGYIDNDDATPNADRNYGLTNQAAARRQAVTL